MKRSQMWKRLLNGHNPFPSKSNKLSQNNTGLAIEDQAADWLQQQDIQIIARNRRCRFGEIDIIASDTQNQLLFIEVRFRSNTHFGHGSDTVDYRKQKKIVAAARWYLANEPHYQQHICRFDVISARPGSSGAIEFDWIKQAFTE